MTRPTSAERQAMRERWNTTNGPVFLAQAERYIPTLLDALDEAEQEVARLKVLVAFVRGLVDEEQAIAATGMNRFALRVWRGDVGREGAALVQAAGGGKG